MFPTAIEIRDRIEASADAAFGLYPHVARFAIDPLLIKKVSLICYYLTCC